MILDLLESKDRRYFPEDDKDVQRKTLYTNGQMLSISLTVMSFMTKTLIPAPCKTGTRFEEGLKVGQY